MLGLRIGVEISAPVGRGTLLNRRKKLSDRLPRDLRERDAARFGQNLRRLDYISRFVALAAKRIGREIRRVGFDKDAVRRQLGRDRAQRARVFEGQNAGEGDEEAERDGAPRKLRTAGEAMQHSREGALPGFFFENARHVGVGFARMDDQRQAGLARGGDMGAKSALLRIARAVVVVIIEPRFADRDDFRVPRMGDQIVRRDVQLFVRIMRMRADRAKNIGKALCDRQHAGEAAHARRDGDKAPDAGVSGARDDRVELAGKIGKVEMAMAVDQHCSSPRYCAARASASI